MYARRLSTCIEPRDHGGQHGQESEKGKEGKEDNQEEKEVTVRRKPHWVRIASEVRYARRSTDRRQLSPTEHPEQQIVRPDPYADGCCITVRFFVGA
jgi:hypothetical protein